MYSVFCCLLSFQQVKLGSPDYTNCNTDEAVEDFMKRIKCYENSYETLDEVLDRWDESGLHLLQLAGKLGNSTIFIDSNYELLSQMICFKFSEIEKYFDVCCHRH